MNIEDILKTAPNPHVPEKLPINLQKVITSPDVISLIGKANNALGAYKGFLYNTTNPALLLSPLISQEAVLSSKLEGTHATLEDFINFDAGNSVPIEKDEMHEVMNYRKALFFAVDQMSTINDDSEEGIGKLPLSSRLIKEIHKILLSNVRGATKTPGEYKTVQNYIGGPQSITFTPLPPRLTNEYMSNLEKYIHYEEIDILVQAALIHVQFEMIHPFLDGNGRIGRLLIPLFLYYREVLPFPTFYMSAYFEADRNLYLQMLASVSSHNDLLPWIKYFLTGISIQAQENTQKAKDLLELYDIFKDTCIKNINSKNAILLLDYIFARPAFKADQAKEALSGLSDSSVYFLLNSFIDNGILTKDDKKRNITYYCPELISLL